jgi:hypothetical protein
MAILAACSPQNDADAPDGGTWIDNANPDAGSASSFDAGALPDATNSSQIATPDAANSALRDAQPETALDASNSSDAGSDASSSVPCHSDTSNSGIPGVSIHIEGDRCTFAYGQGGSFRYRVAVERVLPYHVAASNSCGFCGKYSSDAQSLVLAIVVGNDGQYCATCDVGCCPPDNEGSYELGIQTLTGTLEWPAQIWNGPSDTFARPGAFFAKGQATVSVALTLPGGGMAFGKLPITIE